jgi:autotransporter-associated beta strand protein
LLNSDAGKLTVSGNINLSAGTQDFVLRGDGDGEISGQITGSQRLFKSSSGTGTWILSGDNSSTFTGRTSISNGAIQVASEANLGAVPGSAVANQLTLGGSSTNGTLKTTGTMALSANRGVTLSAGGGTLDTASSTTLTINSIITGDGMLTKSGGSGTAVLAAANTFTGGTTLNAGTLAINHAAALGSGALTINGGTIDNTSGAAITLSTNNALNLNADFTFAGTHDLNLGAGAVTLNANRTVTVSAGTLTIGGAIGGNYSLTGTGPGTLLLTGASDYSGETTVQSGATLSVGGNGSLGDTSSGTVVNAGAALVLNNVNYTDAEPLNITGTGTAGAGALLGGGTSSFAGPITLGGNATIGSGGGTFSLGGNIDKTGTVLTFAGGGTINVNGSIIGNSGSPNSDLVVDSTTVNLNSSNSYNGPTYIRNAGVVNANVANALPTTNGRSAISLDDTGSGSSSLTLGASQSIASLAGAASSSLNLNATILTIGTTSGSTTFAGTLSGSGGSLVKDGGSTLVLSGNNNSYTGGTSVNAGTLLINGDNSLATGAVTVAVGATLGGDGTVGGATTIQGTHSPGNSPDIQTFAAGLTYSTGATFVWELIRNDNNLSNRGVFFDGVNVSDSPLSISSGATSSLVFNSAGSNVNWSDSFWSANRSWLVFTSSAGITGSTFGSIIASADSSSNAFGANVGAFSWRIAGNDLFLDFTAVPEPTSLGGALVLLGLWAARRRPARRSR